VIRIFLSAILIAAALRADSLQAVLQRMDEGARKFKSVAANLKEVNYTAVLQETSTQTGDLRLERRAKEGVVGIMHFNPPEESTIGFKGHLIEKYYPKMNQVQRIDVGKNAAQIDQFILLTFGAAGSDLENNYDVKFAGTETIDGKKCSHLQLTPKSADARKLATMVEMWIPEDKSYAVQQKVTEPSGNYVLNSYTDVKIPASLPDSAFELKYPANAKVVKLK
jgi:outer membrane lipoprotein-sorting protein